MHFAFSSPQGSPSDREYGLNVSAYQRMLLSGTSQTYHGIVWHGGGGGGVLFWRVLASDHFAFMGFNLDPAAFSSFDLALCCHISSRGGMLSNAVKMLSNAIKKTIGSSLSRTKSPFGGC